MALSSPNQDLAEETRAAMERQLEQQTRDATSGVLRRPGRGKRAGQWVQSGGEFNNLTQDEVYGRLRARQGGNSGSGPGGGLRTGGLSQGSGIDWLKANGPDRYSPSRLRQMERNVDITGDAGKLSKVDQVIFDKQESDKAAKAAADAKAAKAAADAKAAAVQPTAPAAPAQFDSLNTPVGQTAKPAIPPMIARPAVPATPASPDPLAPASANPYPKAAPVEPLRITNVNGNSENTKGDTSKFVRGVDWSGGTSQPPPPVLQKPAPQAFVPDAKTKLAQSMEDVKNMQSKDRRDSVLNSAKSMIANPRAIPYGGAYADQFNERDPKRFDNDPAFQEWQKTDPDAIANRDREAGARASLQGFVNRGDAMKERAAKNMETNAVGTDHTRMDAIVDAVSGFDGAASIAKGKERAAGLRSSMTQPLPPPVLQKPAKPPVPATASATPPGAINPANPLAGPAPTALDEARARKAKYEATHSAEGFGPKTKEDIIFSEYAKLPAEGATPPSPSPSNGINPRLQPGYAAQQAAAAKAADREARKTVLYPNGDAPAHDPLHKGLFKFDDRTKKSPLAAPSNPLDPVKVSQNPRTRGIPPLGGSPTPPVLQKPTPPNNQSVVGNPANKRKTNPLSNMLKGLV